MKKILVFATLVLVVFSAFGQTPDTTYTTIGQTAEAFEKMRFIDRYDYVFGTQTPTRFLLKWNTLGLLPLVMQGENERRIRSQPLLNSASIDLRAEAKLAPMLSLQVAGAFYRYSPTVYNRGGDLVDIRVEPRWYFDMPSRIRAGKSANNLTGNYIGLEGRRRWFDNGSYNTFETNSLSLRFGMQRRLWRYGFFDLSYGVGYLSGLYRYGFVGSPSSLGEYKNQSAFGEARVALGFALGGRKSQRDGGGASVCDVFRCFQEDRRMFKLDLFRALRFDQDLIAFHPRVSWEQKIGQSPFSVELEGEVEANGFREVFRRGVYYWKYGVGVSIQPRYYFLQNRQIARGKSGNNLNGLFLGTTLGYRLADDANYFNGPGPINILYTAPHLGVQYRLFKKGFIQYKFGVMWSDPELNEFSDDPTSWYSDLKIGVAF